MVVESLSRVWLLRPHGRSLPSSSIHGILQARILESVAIPSVGDLPNPGIGPRSPAFQADSLPTELGGNPPGIHLFSLRCMSLWSSPTAPPPPQRFPKNPLKTESSLCLLSWNSFFLWFISSSKVQNMAFIFIICPLSATTFIGLPLHKPNTLSIKRP